jgi:signal recognition particle receptor subunit beta
MPVVNPLARELVFKVVYYGPGLGGKTTSLQYIHATSKPEHRGKMVSLATAVDRTLYFDFLPIRVPNVRGMSVKLQLFTVPGQVHYNATRKLVLTGADAVVLVYDSQSARSDANLEALDNLRDNLAAHGRALNEMPHVVAYNKRDLFDVAPLDELDRQLNGNGAPSFATTATTGEGVYEALEAITRAVLDHFEHRVPLQRGVERTSLELPEGGLVEAMKRAEDSDAWSEELAERAARAVQRHPSGVMLLSDLPESDVGEAAARAVSHDARVAPDSDPRPTVLTPPPHRQTAAVPPMSEPPPAPAKSAPAFSFGALWPEAEQKTVAELEACIAQGEYERSVSLADQLLSRSLAGAANLLGGGADSPRDPATAALLLGLNGPRYLEFRALVKDARGGRSVGESDALRAYAMTVEARLARTRLRQRT